MGTECKNVAFSSCLICIVFVSFVVGQDDLDVSPSGERRTRMHMADRHADGRVCRCPPCMTGKDCSENVTLMEPRFSTRFTFVEVDTEHHRHGVPLKYNHTTYPADAHCPCDAFEYTISSVENEMKPDDPARFGLFKINRKTGRIRLAEDRASDITASDLYHLVISVRNIITDLSAQTNITVARENSPEQNQFSLGTENGYEERDYHEEHVIHKRATVIPSEVNLNLSQTNTVSGVRVGTRLGFRLDIVFPLTSTDISVELFTPDNETTVMILCDVKIEHIGGNLGTTLPGDPTFVAKDGWDVNSAPDMAILKFGVVTNNGSDTANVDASTITISYAAVMIDNSLTTDGGVYWVSAGAEYENEHKLWVGQASYEVINDGDQAVSLEPEFNVSMPTNIALGSSLAVTVDMFLPYPSRTYTFKVFTPADTIGVMSICAIWFDGFGQNFGCGNDVNKISTSTEDDPQAAGNAIGVVNFGTLLNKASRDEPVNSIVVQDNKVALTFIVHMYPDETRVNQLLSLGLSLEVDSDTMLIGSTNFTVDPEVTVGLTDPQFVSVMSSLNSTMSDATVGQPFMLTYDLKVPFPVTEGVASHYILELLAPFDVTPKFSVCSFEVIYVGQDLPCIKTDDLVTEYSSRVADGSSIEPDRATIDLGFVTKFNLTGNNDDIIRVKAMLKPLASHISVVAPSTHTVSLGVQVGSNSVSLTDVSITIANEEIITPVTNDTAPAFTMTFYDANDNVAVTGSTKVIMNMTTSRNISYDAMNMEFIMPISTEYSYFHLCRVDIVSNGKNMPCMTPEWYEDLIEYTSNFGNYEIDHARLTTGKMCNYQFEDDVSEDVTSFAFYLKLLNRPDLLTSQWLSMGLQYSSNNIWVGQLKLFATTGVSVSHTKSVYVANSRNTTTSPIPIGHTVSYSLLIKIGRGDTTHLIVKATAESEGAHICTVRVVAAGSNLPCVVDEVATRTYTLWPSGSGRQDVELDLGIITNFGDYSENKTANNFFDADSIIIEVLVRANPAQPANTYPIDINVYFNLARTAVSSIRKTDFVTTEALPGDTSIPDPVNVTFTVGEITGGLDNSTEMAIGEAKRVLITAVIPEGTNYDLEFAFIIPVNHVGKIEICDAAIVSVGDNLPCIDVLTEAVKTSSGGIFTDTATFNLGYTCNRPIRPGDTRANTVVFEAYIRALRNGFTFVGDIVTVTASMRTFLSQVDVDSIDFTVTDPSLFVDRVLSLDQVTNETLISLDAANPLVLGIGQNWTVKANISVPKHSVSKFLFDVELPTSDSACLTVNDVRVIGSVGRNILCVEPDVNSKSIVHAPQYNSTSGTSQRNYVFLDLGIVTNTGLTYRRDTFNIGDDDVQIEFDIQMADCSISDHGTVHKLSIGNKVADYVFIYEHDVQVFRDGNEKPDINLVLNVGPASTSTTIYVEGMVFHSNMSTAEGRNTSVFISVPAYQLAPGSLFASSNNTCTIVPIAGHTAILQILCENFFFTDVLTFTLEIQINTAVVLPVGFSGTDSVAQSWVGTFYVSRFNTFDIEDWYPYPVSGQNELKFSVDGGIDKNELFALGLEDAGIVSDCQITSSLGDIAPSTLARLNSAGGWRPFVRYANFAADRYLVVYFGNLHKFVKMAVQQDTGCVYRVTEVAVEYTNDGASWFGEETISMGPLPSTLENVTLSGVKARGVKVSLTNDTAYGIKADVGVKFEFYGVQLTTDVTQAEACNALAKSQLSVPVAYPAFGARSFVVDTISNEVFVCDRRVNSKAYVGQCTTSSDLGNSWEKLDQRFECMIGYESSQGRLYAYARGRKIMMREAGGLWQNVPLAAFEEDRLLSTWTNAIIVPEQVTAELDRITPHASYRINTWGATIDGMFESNVKKMSWNAT